MYLSIGKNNFDVATKLVKIFGQQINRLGIILGNSSYPNRHFGYLNIHVCFGVLPVLARAFSRKSFSSKSNSPKKVHLRYIVINQRPRNKIRREHSPLTVYLYKMENRVPYLM